MTHPECDEGHITSIVQQIAPSVTQARETGKNGSELVEEATNRHLQYLEASLLRESHIIREALDQGRLDLVVAKYQLQTGKVDVLSATFFESF